MESRTSATHSSILPVVSGWSLRAQAQELASESAREHVPRQDGAPSESASVLKLGPEVMARNRGLRDEVLDRAAGLQDLAG